MFVVLRNTNNLSHLLRQKWKTFFLSLTNFKHMRILILCTGNSCRSQMAHGFLQSFDAHLTVRSAGTAASGKLNEKL